MPALGVGIVYNSALEPLLATRPELVDVLEIEPQTTWIEVPGSDAPYVARPDVADHLAALPGRKLVHSIGAPVGGSVRPHSAQVSLLRDAVRAFGAPWASEHLSFNLTSELFTGFFLPPRQTDEGIRVCVEAIRSLRDELGVPLAVETGVNYLRTRPDEIPDGEFVAAVVEAANCGILLDLHNVYCNARNGRQPVEQFLSELPLERVWELHLAGGFELGGYWLDAHSGAIPAPLEEMCRDLVPDLPNLKAMVFEVFSSFLPRFGLEGVTKQLEGIRDLWGCRATSAAAALPREHPAQSPKTPITPGEWENALGRLVAGRVAASELEKELAADPGVGLMQGLVKEFRASMVVGVYRLSSRLLMLALGPDIFRAFLEDFWSTSPPRQYAGTEAAAFADYLVAKNLRVPQFRSILAFEQAALDTLRDGTSRVVRFNVDPLPMLRALADGVLLQEPGAPGEYEIEVTADGTPAVAGTSSETLTQTFPFH